MKIGFKLTRNKNKGIIEEGYIEVKLEDALKDIPLEDNRYINALTYILQNTLTQYISDLPEIKKYGSAYIGGLEITGIVIEDTDELYITREEFLNEIHTKMPKLAVVYDKQVTNISNEEKSVKIDSNNNEEE